MRILKNPSTQLPEDHEWERSNEQPVTRVRRLRPPSGAYRLPGCGGTRRCLDRNKLVLRLFELVVLDMQIRSLAMFNRREESIRDASTDSTESVTGSMQPQEPPPQAPTRLASGGRSTWAPRAARAPLPALPWHARPLRRGGGPGRRSGPCRRGRRQGRDPLQRRFDGTRLLSAAL